MNDERLLRREIAEKLKNGGIEFADFEANQLVGEFFDGSENSLKALHRAVERRIAREPLQYIIGQWEFYGLPFFVGDGVLIPRQDTETLVDEALRFLKSRRACSAVDLCSGSGCIAVSVAKNAPNCSVTAVEKYPEAFRYLEKNTELNGVSVKCVSGDAISFCENASPQEYDLVLSNPPYIPSDDIGALEPEVKSEPKTALDGGEDGLFFYRALAETVPRILKDGGRIMVEIGYDQKSSVTEIFSANGFSNIKCIKDLSGNDRVISATVRTVGDRTETEDKDYVRR